MDHTQILYETFDLLHDLDFGGTELETFAMHCLNEVDIYSDSYLRFRRYGADRNPVHVTFDLPLRPWYWRGATETFNDKSAYYKVWFEQGFRICICM